MQPFRSLEVDSPHKRVKLGDDFVVGCRARFRHFVDIAKNRINKHNLIKNSDIAKIGAINNDHIHRNPAQHTAGLAADKYRPNARE